MCDERFLLSCSLADGFSLSGKSLLLKSTTGLAAPDLLKRVAKAALCYSCLSSMPWWLHWQVTSPQHPTVILFSLSYGSAVFKISLHLTEFVIFFFLPIIILFLYWKLCLSRTWIFLLINLGLTVVFSSDLLFVLIRTIKRHQNVAPDEQDPQKKVASLAVKQCSSYHLFSIIGR